MDELGSLAELLWMLVSHPGTGALIALLVAAAVIDWRSLRIPNWLTVPGMVYGLVFNATHATTGMGGLTFAALGLATGLVLLLPLYVIRVLGAGDVKLLAAVGAFLGAAATLKAAVFVFVVGGIAAVAYAVARGATRQLAGNLRDIAWTAAARGVPLWRPGGGNVSVGKLPYGISISAGTIAFLVARQLDFL